MSAKENAAVGQLFELLESRYALRVLWALKDGHPQMAPLVIPSPHWALICSSVWPKCRHLQASGLPA
jgi:hypothetical protein